jgi:hypothetical protein
LCGACLRPGSLTIVPSRPILPSKPCAPEPELPALAPVFAPLLTGGLVLDAARGDTRLTAPARSLSVWSADSSLVALTGAGSVSVFSATDGKLLDFVPCPGGAIPETYPIWSPDGRWIAMSGVSRPPHAEHRMTCIVDRTNHVARVLPIELAELSFDPSSATLVGRDTSTNDGHGDPPTSDAWGLAIDLATGSMHRSARLPAVTAPRRWPAVFPDVEGAEGTEVSHDGSLIVGWRDGEEIPASRRSGERGRASQRPPAPLLSGGLGRHDRRALVEGHVQALWTGLALQPGRPRPRAAVLV